MKLSSKNGWLSRDRERKAIVHPARFAEGDMVSFSLVPALQVEAFEPRTYQELITC